MCEMALLSPEQLATAAAATAASTSQQQQGVEEVEGVQMQQQQQGVEPAGQQQQQQQQEEAEMPDATGTLPVSSSSAAAAGGNDSSPSSSNSDSSPPFAAVAQQLWQLVQGLSPKLPPPNPRPCRKAGQEGCFARRLLLLLPQLGPSPADSQGLLLTEAVTLLLLLLYDGQFKFDVTLHLLDCYSWLLQLVGEAQESEGEALSAALDRLTVQLFNAEAVS